MTYIKNLKDKTREELSSFEFPNNFDNKCYVYLVNPSNAWGWGTEGTNGIYYFIDEPVQAI